MVADLCLITATNFKRGTMQIRPQIMTLGLALVAVAAYALYQEANGIANTIAGGLIAVLTGLARKAD